MSVTIPSRSIREGEDVRGLQIAYCYQGRHMLGDVVESYRDSLGVRRLRVRHFNGESWPVDPAASIVDVLMRGPHPDSEGI